MRLPDRMNVEFEFAMGDSDIVVKAVFCSATPTESWVDSLTAEQIECGDVVRKFESEEELVAAVNGDAETFRRDLWGYARDAVVDAVGEARYEAAL